MGKIKSINSEFVAKKSSEWRANSDKFKETNDCAVHTTSTLFGISYGKAKEALERAGRQHRSPACIYQIVGIGAVLGFNCIKIFPDQIIAQYPGRQSTLKNVTSHHPERFPEVWSMLGERVMLDYPDHVGPVIGGINIDHTIGRRRHAVMVYSFIRPGEPIGKFLKGILNENPNQLRAKANVVG